MIRADSVPLNPAPAWARPDGNWREISEAAALYFAAAALDALEAVARSDAWSGVWRPMSRRRAMPDRSGSKLGRGVHSTLCNHFRTVQKSRSSVMQKRETHVQIA
jgi:hypothetical protein